MSLLWINVCWWNETTIHDISLNCRSLQYLFKRSKSINGLIDLLIHHFVPQILFFWVDLSANNLIPCVTFCWQFRLCPTLQRQFRDLWGLWIPRLILAASPTGRRTDRQCRGFSVVWVFTYPRVHSNMSSVTRGVYQALDCIRGWTTTLFSRNSYFSSWKAQPTKQVFHELGHGFRLRQVVASWIWVALLLSARHGDIHHGPMVKNLGSMGP